MIEWVCFAVFGYVMLGLWSIALVSELSSSKLPKWQAILIFLLWPLGILLLPIYIIISTFKDHVE